jgi:hypothetical protein
VGQVDPAAEKSDGPVLSLSAVEGVGPAAEPPRWPHALEVLRFMLSDEPALEYADADRAWRWQRHA